MKKRRWNSCNVLYVGADSRQLWEFAVGKGGIVRDPVVQQRVVEEISAAADALGLKRAGVTESPIAGMEGNREFLIHLR